MDRLDSLAAHGEHQHAGEFPAGKAKQRGLTADWQGDQRLALPPEVQQVPGHVFSAGDHRRRPASVRPEIDVAPRVRGEHLEQAAELTVRARGDELLGDLAMFGGNSVEADAAVGCRDLLPGPPGQLAAGRYRPANGLGHGVEGHLEDVVQDEDDPLGRAEPLQHDEQGEPDAVVEGDPVGRIGERRARQPAR